MVPERRAQLQEVEAAEIALVGEVVEGLLRSVELVDRYRGQGDAALLGERVDATVREAGVLHELLHRIAHVRRPRTLRLPNREVKRLVAVPDGAGVVHGPVIGGMALGGDGEAEVRDTPRDGIKMVKVVRWHGCSFPRP